MSTTTFLTGATGFVGSHVLRQLVERGDRVRCLVREGSSRLHLEGMPVEVVEGDLLDRESLDAGVAGADLVVHCAADYRLFVPDPREMYRANVEGTRNLLAASAAAGVGRVVHTSSVGALGLEPGGRPADEETPVTLADMIGPYKRSKYLAERVAEQWAERGLDVVIVNPSTPVGDGDVKPTATGRMILDFLNARVPAYVDTGLNLIDVADVARGHLLAAERGRRGRRYILGHRNLSLVEIYRMLSEISGLPAPRRRLPHWLPLAVARVDTWWARRRGVEPRVAEDAVRLARHPMYFDSARAVRELGLPQRPVELALRRAAEWFGEHGYVRPRSR